jgi:RHS repeat-associated protein
VFFTLAAFGQDTQNTQNTIDQNMRSSGRVNPSTLGMEFDLPLGSYPGRGISMPLGISYSSKQWRFEDDESIQQPGAPKYVFAVAKYSENAAAGWTSSLSQPYIEYTGQYDRFDLYGRPLPGEQLGGGQTSPPGDYYVRRITVFLPGGAAHELRASDAPISNPNNLNYPPDSVWEGTFYATDGSGVKYVQNSSASPTPIFRLYMPDGTYYDFNSSREQKSSTDYTEVRRGNKLTDVHGNYIQFNAPNAPAGYPNGSWTDQLGRTFPIMVPREAPTLEENETVFEQSFLMPGQDQAYVLRWRPLLGESESQSDSAFTDVGSQALHYAGTTSLGQFITPSLFTSGMRIRPCATSTSFLHITVPSGAKFNPVVLSEIVLPTGAKYKFTYNEFGEVERIYYPTGGREEIDYDPVPSLAHLAAPYQQTNRGVTERRIYESDSDSTADTWGFSAAASDNNYRTSVIAPDTTRTDTFMHRGVPGPTCTQENTTGYDVNYFGTRWGYDNILAGMVYETRNFSSTGHIMQRSLTRYSAFTTSVLLRYISNQYVQRNPRKVTTELITYDGDTGLSGAVKNESDTDIDDFGSPQNTTKTKEYAFSIVSGGNGFSPGEAPPTALVTLSDPTASATLVRTTETTYENGSTYRGRNLLRLATQIIVKDSAGNTKSKSQVIYDEPSYIVADTPTGTVPGYTNPNDGIHGLPTTTKKWFDIANNQYVETHVQYNQFGSSRKMWDAKQNVSEVQYTDNFSDSTDRNTFAFPTKAISVVPGGNGSTTAFETRVKYKFETGLPVLKTDENGKSTVIEYNDPLLRPTKVTLPNGQDTLTEYGEPDSYGKLPAGERYVRIRSEIDDGRWTDAYSWFDGLGRSTKTQKVDSAGDVIVETEYDEMDRGKKVSNPYRPGETVLKTENTYDGLGRVIKTTTPDNSETVTTYGLATSGSQIGTMITVEDQSDKVMRSISDAQGHLLRMDEPTDSGGLGTLSSPSQSTIYGYDTLNNLVSVTQGAQPRSFEYDSLSRLKQATNPESGVIKYSYDANGNVQTKRDDRGIKTIYDYDGLNRNIKRCYRVIGSGSLGATSCAAAGSETIEPNTPEITYYYDNLTNAKNKLIKIHSSISVTEYTAFDDMSRPTAHKQTTNSTDYTTAYVYNLAGQLVEETYPSTRKVKNLLDTEGEISAVKSKKNSASGYWNYADNFKYNPMGAVSSVQLGNGSWESTLFNNRLQPKEINLGKTPGATNVLRLQYEYGKWESGSLNTGKNNGSVGQQIITLPNGGSNLVFTQKYDYDSTNRIKDATETGSSGQTWRQAYTYDRYGNRNFDEANTTTLTKSCGTSPNFTVCPADRKKENPEILASNNRIKSDQDGDSVDDYTFDSSGNTTKQANGMTFVYDAENKQIEVKNSSQVTLGQYSYDGEGKRVKKYVPGTGEITVFVYDALGKMVAEYSTSLNPTPQVSYLTNDHLGSARINTNENGAVIARHDYRPFGEEIVTSQRTSGVGYAADNNRKQFTGYEFDAEIGLNYAINRYLSSPLGRFTQVDPYNIIFEKEKGKDGDERSLILVQYISTPQIWNRYSYVLNDPLKYTDPDGRRPQTPEETADLARLRQKAADTKDEKLKAAILDAVARIEKAIAASPSQAKDPRGLKTVLWAISRLGATRFGVQGTAQFERNGYDMSMGPGNWKCNFFVASALTLGGIVPLGDGGIPVNGTVFGAGAAVGSYSLPSANDWASMKPDAVANFTLLLQPMPEMGDVVAWANPDGSGHSSISSGGNLVIYAGRDDVKVQTLQYVRADQASHGNDTNAVYRRFKR